MLKAAHVQASSSGYVISIETGTLIPASKLMRFIYDAHGGTEVPGTLCLEEDGNLVENSHINIVYKRLKWIYEFFNEVYGYKILDGSGTQLHVTLNYGKDCMNAYWTGTQVVLGSGCASSLDTFYNAPDVLVHEFTHGIIASTSGLNLRDESGALSEHLADVFGILFKLYDYGKFWENTPFPWSFGDKLFSFGYIPSGHEGQGPLVKSTHLKPKQQLENADRDAAPWIMPLGDSQNAGVMVAGPEQYSPYWGFEPWLRSFKDPNSGTPPQPCNYEDIERPRTDNGGVHINAGIPNFAFYTAAMEHGGFPWEGVGRPWFRAMVDPNLGADCTFAKFAATTIFYAKKDYPHLVPPIAKGWDAAGVKFQSTSQNGHKDGATA